MKITSKALGLPVILGLFLGFFLLITVFWVSIWNYNKSQEAAEWTTHTEKVLTDISLFLSLLQDAETGQRGYIMTGQDHYLEPYLSGVKLINESFINLKNQTKDNPYQQTNLLIIDELVDSKLQELRETIDLRRTKGLDAALAIIKQDQGKKIMDNIRLIVSKMEKEEHKLYDQRTKTVKEKSLISIYTQIIGIVLAILAIIFVIWKMKANSEKLNKEVAERKKAQVNLNFSRDQYRSLYTHVEFLREKEKTLLAREVHDDLGQVLSFIRMDFMGLSNEIPLNKSNNKIIKNLTKTLDTALRKVQDITTTLRPPELNLYGLCGGIRSMCTEIQDRTKVLFQFQSNLEDMRFNPDVEIMIFRIAQEAITNALRHGNPRNISLQLLNLENKLTLDIADDGKGIDESKIDSTDSFGLLGLRERARAIRGIVKIKNLKNENTGSKGTNVTLVVPIDKNITRDEGLKREFKGLKT